MQAAYRADIDGLRALAVLAVVVFHAGGAPGGFVGVDVFFVISGYLISRLLVRELEGKRRVRLVHFWARRVRRLVPAALLVIVVSLTAAAWLLPAVHWKDAAHRAQFAATYTTNWGELAAGVRYFAPGDGVPLFLHYWSLAVEEQFYLWVTLLLVVGALIARWSRRDPGAAFLTLLVGSGVISLIVSFIAIADAQPHAFFGTHARIWQFAAGAMITAWERRGPAPLTPIFNTTLAWVGCGLIGLSIAWFDDQLRYPGGWALLPTLGAVALIVAGTSGASRVPLPNRWLGRALPVAIGKASYSIYLWHWPVFLLVRHQMGSAAPSVVVGLGLTAALSALSYRFFERPIRHSAWLGGRSRVCVIGAVGISLAVTGAAVLVEARAHPQTFITLNGKQVDPEIIRRDRPKPYQSKPRCHLEMRAVDQPKCIYGVTDSPRAVFLFGDSLAAQWFPALESLANKQGFALRVRTKNACPPVTTSVHNQRFGRAYNACNTWRRNVLKEMQASKPELVILSSAPHYRPAEGSKSKRKAILAEGEKRMLTSIRQTGARVVYLVNTPRQDIDPIDCLSIHGSSACRTPRARAMKDRSPWSVKASRPNEDVQLIDMTDHFCDASECRILDHGRLMFRDKRHLTADYAKSLSPALEQALMPSLEPER